MSNHPTLQYDIVTDTDAAPAHVIDHVRGFITRYVNLPGEHYADILALYALHTHAFDTARTTPYIYLTSKGPGSGKTRVMEVLSEICRASNMQAGITGPTFFALIEARKPTFFMDEVDTIYGGAKNEELRGVLNSGYKHNGSIARADKSSEDGFRDYSTFCPKVLAGIDNGQVPDTVLDRSITIVLEKAAAGTVEPFYSEDIEDEAADLQDAIRTWYATTSDRLRDRSNRPDALPELSDRQNDIIRPLLTIANQIPGWGDRARRAFIRALGPQTTPLSPQAKTLLAARDWLDTNQADRISSATLQGIAGISGKQLANWFRAFGIEPGNYKIDGKNARGFLKVNMTDAFDRYLPNETEV